MLLQGKTTLIYGGSGAIGGAAARAFADAGARVHLAGRSRARLEQVANDIGDARVAEVDALDERAVTDHADAVAAEAGRIDIALNAVSFPFVHEAPFAELAVDEIMHPIVAYLRTNLITAKAVAPHMAAQRSGTILMLSAAASRAVAPGTVGFGTACTAIETMTQRLAVELGPSGVRVVCLRAHLLADGPAHGSSTRELFERRAAAAGVDVEQWVERCQENVTLLGRLPTLASVADAATFLASDRAGATTGAVLDLTSGNAVRTKAGVLVGLFG